MKLVAAGGVVAFATGETTVEFRKATFNITEYREKTIDYVFGIRKATSHR